MKYRVKRDLQFYRSGKTREMVTLPAGTVVTEEYIPDLNRFDGEAFEKRFQKDQKAGFPEGQLVVFTYEQGHRSAYCPRDLEPVGWFDSKSPPRYGRKRTQHKKRG